MKELRNLIIAELTSDYTIEEASEMLNKAQIIIKFNQIKVIYDNEKVDVFELRTIERLELIGH